jgi:hypothetical protein
MDIDRAIGRDIQHRLRQDAAIRDDDEEVRVASLMALAALPAAEPIVAAFALASAAGGRTGALATALLSRARPEQGRP